MVLCASPAAARTTTGGSRLSFRSTTVSSFLRLPLDGDCTARTGPGDAASADVEVLGHPVLDLDAGVGTLNRAAHAHQARESLGTDLGPLRERDAPNPRYLVGGPWW